MNTTWTWMSKNVGHVLTMLTIIVGGLTAMRATAVKDEARDKDFQFLTYRAETLEKVQSRTLDRLEQIGMKMEQLSLIQAKTATLMDYHLGKIPQTKEP